MSQSVWDRPANERIRQLPRRDDAAVELNAVIDRRPMSDRERQRVSAAYGFRSWDDYQAVKAAGLTVAELRELAERRAW